MNTKKYLSLFLMPSKKENLQRNSNLTRKVLSTYAHGNVNLQLQRILTAKDIEKSRQRVIKYKF